MSVVQAALSTDELLVEYVVGVEESFVLPVTGDSVRAHKVPKSKDLDSLVRDYTEEARTAIAERLRINSHVGFDSLVDDRGEYLVRSHVISYVPSATVLQLLRNRPRI